MNGLTEYRAQYADRQAEYIWASDDTEATEVARDHENEHGRLLNLFLIDVCDNAIRTVT